MVNTTANRGGDGGSPRRPEGALWLLVLLAPDRESPIVFIYLWVVCYCLLLAHHYQKYLIWTLSLHLTL
jgi:hypothetical protein